MATGATDIRVALVGYGYGGSTFHAPLISTTPAMVLAGVVTRDPARAAEVGRRYPGCRVLDRPDDLFAEPGAWDVIVVSTPNRTHVGLATAALEAGLHCVVDKPVAADPSAARDLGRLAAARARLLVPFHNRRWDGDFLTVRALVDDGRLGTVHRFESRFERWRPDPSVGRGPGWKDDPDPAAGGGLLFDLGSHLVDQALVLWGRPRDVYAELDARRPGVHVDDDAFVALSWNDGRRAHLWASALAADPGPRFRVLGSRSAYVKWGMDPQEDALRGGLTPAVLDWGAAPPDTWGRLGGDPVPTVPGAYPRFYAALASSVRDGAPPPVAWADAVTGLEILDAARRSAAGRSVVELAPPQWVV